MVLGSKASVAQSSWAPRAAGPSSSLARPETGRPLRRERSVWLALPLRAWPTMTQIRMARNGAHSAPSKQAEAAAGWPAAPPPSLSLPLFPDMQPCCFCQSVGWVGHPPLQSAASSPPSPPFPHRDHSSPIRPIALHPLPRRSEQHACRARCLCVFAYVHMEAIAGMRLTMFEAGVVLLHAEACLCM